MDGVTVTSDWMTNDLAKSKDHQPGFNLVAIGTPALKCGAMSPTSSHNYGYDRRFAGLFLGELEMRGSPHYPDCRWFTALRRADYEYQRIGPLKPIGSPGLGHRALPGEVAGVPEGTEKQLYSHNYGDRDPDRLSAEVRGACTRWLNERQIYG